jgi:hypothetical protein
VIAIIVWTGPHSSSDEENNVEWAEEILPLSSAQVDRDSIKFKAPQATTWATINLKKSKLQSSVRIRKQTDTYTQTRTDVSASSLCQKSIGNRFGSLNLLLITLLAQMVLRMRREKELERQLKNSAIVKGGSFLEFVATVTPAAARYQRTKVLTIFSLFHCNLTLICRARNGNAQRIVCT